MKRIASFEKYNPLDLSDGKIFSHTYHELLEEKDLATRFLEKVVHKESKQLEESIVYATRHLENLQAKSLILEAKRRTAQQNVLIIDEKRSEVFERELAETKRREAKRKARKAIKKLDQKENEIRARLMEIRNQKDSIDE